MADSRAGRVLWQLHHWLGSTAMPADDGRLLEHFVRHSDEEAFAELVSRHGPLVFGLCRRLLGNVQDAEDAFQATFFVLARRAATIRKPESLASFLHGIAYRLALKLRSETNKRRLHERRSAAPTDSQETDLSWREVRGLLDEELQRLPEKQRVPLVLCYLEGLTQDEASRRLGWPRGTLKRRLETGRERLRIRLLQRGVTLGAGLFAIALTESTAKGGVSMSLHSATVRAAMQFVTRQTTALAATPAALLAKGALQTMVTTKLKLSAIVVLLFGCVVTAAGLAIPQAPENQPKNKAEASAPARPAEISQMRKDLHGDPLPKGAKARLGTLRLRHQSQTASAVFTRDSKTAIAGDVDGLVVYWDVASGKEVRRLPRMQGAVNPPQGAVNALAITRDGETLAAASWGSVFLWEASAGKLISRIKVTDDAITQMLFTPDGKTLAIRSQGDMIHLLDVAGEKKLRELKGHTGQVWTMDLSPDGKTLASGSWQDSNIRLWDVASGKEKRQITTGGGDVLSLAFSPDGNTLAAISNREGLAFFDPNTGKQLRKVKDSSWRMNMTQIAYTPDGKTLVGIELYSGLHILDGKSGKHLRKFDAPQRGMSGVTISPDGKTIATFGRGPHSLDLWDAASGKLLHSFEGHRSGITGLAFSAEGATLFSSAEMTEQEVLSWDTTTGKLRGQIYAAPVGGGYRPLALSPNGKLLAASNLTSLELLDPASRKVARACKGLKDLVHIAAVAWSADGKTLISSIPNDKIIHVWDPATGKLRRAIETQQSDVGTLALSPDGAMAAVGGPWDGVVRLWATANGKELRRIAVSKGVPYSLAFNPTGTILASSGRSISLWDPATGELLRRWDTEAGRLAFSSDGRTLVSADLQEATIRLWETETGKERFSFSGQRGEIWSLAISRDGRLIASGSADTTILVWDATAGARPDIVLAADQVRTLWSDLRNADAGRAYRVLWQLALSPKHALPFLSERLRRATPLDAEQQKRAGRLLTDLDSDQFAVRQESEAELVKMGLMIEPALHKALASKPSLEVRRRIESVLANLANERLRMMRALEAIEHMNTPEARRLVEALSEGAPHAWLTVEAQAIRKRLTDGSVTVPER